MKNQERNREKQLERLFEESRASLPELEPDPGLPAHIRALAASRAVSEGRRVAMPRRGLAWLPLAGVAFALSIVAGGYVGYRAWESSQDPAIQQIHETDAFSSALSQSGFADDMATNSEGEE